MLYIRCIIFIYFIFDLYLRCIGFDSLDGHFIFAM